LFSGAAVEISFFIIVTCSKVCLKSFLTTKCANYAKGLNHLGVQAED
jgi:hypothetical protein